MKSFFTAALCFLLASLFFLPTWAAAGKAYIWHDKDGKVHFSDQPPQPEQTGGDIEEREFKEAPRAEPESIAISDNPIEHAGSEHLSVDQPEGRRFRIFY